MSKLRHRDLGGDAAAALARREFPAWLVGDRRALRLPAGQRVVEYAARDVGRVVDTEGKGSLVISSVPIATRAGDSFEPVDLSLSASAGGFTAERPAVPVRLPARADGFVELDDVQLGVRPAGAASVAGKLVDERVFYPEVATDTDYIAQATRAGAEILWQLRSERAPERLVVDLDLPDGASVRLPSTVTGDPGDGSAQIVRGQQILATISAPVAVDADGAPVEASFAVDAGHLVVDVIHRGRDLRYPLLVDPEVREIWGSSDFYGTCGGGPSNFAPGRWGYQQGGTVFVANCGNPEGGAAGLGGPSHRATWSSGRPAGAATLDQLRHLSK